MARVRVGVEVLCGLADPANKSHAPRQLLADFARDCLFGRFIRKRAAARQEILSPRLDRGETAAVFDDDVSRPPQSVPNVRLLEAEDKCLVHDRFYARPKLRRAARVIRLEASTAGRLRAGAARGCRRARCS